MKWKKKNILDLTSVNNKHLKLTTLIIAVILLLSFIMPAMAKRLKPGVDFSGIHFNLNIHGVPDGVEKPVPSDSGSGRHSVFMPINSDNDTRFYYRVEGENWTVTDCDATDPDGNINITLPRTIVNETDGRILGRVEYYMVYLVALGKPSDHSFILYPEAIFENGTKVLYVWDKLEVPGHGKGKKGGGQPYWVNATDWFFLDIELINLSDPTTNIIYTDEWCFNIENLDDYWWKVNNEGIKHIQVRFYPVIKGNGKN